MAAADSTGQQTIRGGVRQSQPHDSAHKHVSGQAVYIDDMPAPPGMLQVYIATSPHAHARIRNMDLSAVQQQPQVHAVLTAADIPGKNDIGPIVADDPLLADGLVEYVGQPLFAVAATTRDAAWRAAQRAEIEFEPLPAVVTVDEAMEQQSFVLAPRHLERGDVDGALGEAEHRLNGRLRIGGQEHFYLEGQVAMAIPGEDGDLQVYSSSQHPTEIQHLVARVAGLIDSAVTVDVRRMGGAFGGKETQAAIFAAMAALVTATTGRPARIVADRDDDIIITGKRHDFRVDNEVGFDSRGRITALDVQMASRCGRSADLSGPVNDRAVFHLDNGYFLENVRVANYRCKTHTASNTAFRGFGGPQGMMAIEHIIDHIAAELGLDPLDVQRVNLYGDAPRDTTPYGMPVEDNILPLVIDQLVESSDYDRRREEAASFNREHRWLKKGIALTPVKFGISFTNTFLNQAGALIHVYTDGSVQLNHGGTEMGQGLMVKVAQVVAEELQIDIHRIKVMATSTGKVPNTSATAASSGADINGKAAQRAARTIKERLTRFAVDQYGVASDRVRFSNNRVLIGDQALSFADIVQQAWMARISLSATGYYRTPKISYDMKTGKGRPFFYFAYGAAVAEVIIDTLTGESRVERVDILHDCGESLNPAIDLGQIEGGFIQGMGWLTSEELVWSDAGQLLTHAPSTYKIPTCGDRPADMRINLLQDSPNRERTVFRSKAVGEPPLMLGISVFRALGNAVRACGRESSHPPLDSPATPETILGGIGALAGADSDTDG